MTPRRARRAAVAVAALALGGCLEVELHGEVRSTGAYVGTAEADIPLKARLDPTLGPVVAGPERDVADSWRARGIEVVPDEADDDILHVRAAALDDLSLDWLRLTWLRRGDSFAYGHTVTMPPEVIGVLQARLESWLAPLASAHGAAPDSPAALAKGLVGASKVVLDMEFPGPVTQTDGERLGENRVRWTWDADDLMTNARPQGHAFGRVSWWRPWWDRLRDLVH